jgi:hypothetical protein
VQVEFDISLDDIAAFNQYHSTCHSLMARRSYRMALVIVPAAVLLCAVLFAPLRPPILRSPIAYWAIPLLVALAWLFFYPRLYQRGLKQMVVKAMSDGQNRGTLGRHLISIDETGLNEKTDVNDSHWNWLGVEQIQQNENYIFVYISSIMAHVIPKRAFPHPDQADEFFSTAEKFLVLSRPTEALR